MVTLFFTAMGWCGTKYPGWWKGPRPEPWRPQPQPWAYIALTVIGIIAGIIGGLAFNNAITNESLFSRQGIIASGLVSFAVSNIVTGLVSPMMNKKQAR